MPNPIKIAVCGICGYGRFYLRNLLDRKSGDIQLVAGIDPSPEQCSMLDELKAAGVEIFDSAENFFSCRTADLLIIASPHQYHSEQTILALSNRCNVLCEKPLCPTIQEAYDIIKARENAMKQVAVGFQWAYSRSFQALKHDAISGVFGRPVRLKTMVLWPRPRQYFSRNSWAGTMKDAHGKWVLDSPVMNAASHFLHAMFFILGDTMPECASPNDITAELYRINKIPSYDTGMLRAHTGSGAELLFYASHAIEKSFGPKCVYEFEKARIISSDFGAEFVAHFNDGSEKKYGAVNHGSDEKISDALEAAAHGTSPACRVEASMCQIICANGAHESQPAIIDFPRALAREGECEDKPLLYINGLAKIIEDCFNKSVLPSENSISWAVPGKNIDLRNYNWFPANLELSNL